MRYLIHSDGFRWLHLDVNGVGSVITVVTLRRMATEILGLFSPLYILNIALNLGMTLKFSILVVIGYVFLVYLSKLLTLPLAENASFRLGYRRTLILSMIPFFAFVGLLSLAQAKPILIVLVAILWGIHAGLFWFSFHGLFVKRADHERFGEQTGICQALYILIGIITPVLGGLIVLQLGYQTLFLVAGAIFTLAMMIALLSKEIRPRRDARIVRVFRLFLTHKKVVAAYFGWGLESSLYGVIWPIFLFLLVGRILSFGEIVSASVLVAALTTYLIGRFVDKLGGRKFISWGSMISFLTWVGRTMARTPLAIIGIDGLYRVTEQMIQIPLNVECYQKAVLGGTGKAIYFREIALNFGAVIGFLIAAFLVFLGLPLWCLFILASLGSLAPLSMTRRE